MSDTLFSTEAHVYLPLADPALPRKETEQRQDRALKDAFARKASILLMTTIRTWPHERTSKA